MKFETLKKDNRKYWILAVITILLIGTSIFFVATRANYRVTEKVNIANGIINWDPVDFTIASIKLSDDGSNYTDTNTIPIKGYNLSNKSYCEVRGTKDTSIPIEYKDGELSVGMSTKNTKCYIYFDKIKSISTSDILASKTKDNSRSSTIKSALTENTTGKVFTVRDDDGTSYVYAGVVNDNWVKFGGFYWRIIRVNGDGSIRMIYNGTTTEQTGTGAQISTSKFNSASNMSSANYAAYIGYMYGQTSTGVSYDELMSNRYSSTIKNVLDSWYNTNLNKAGIKEYIDTNAGFCGDRNRPSEIWNGQEYVTNKHGLAATIRLDNNYIDFRVYAPSLKCIDSKDLYTVSSSNKGNKALTYPIGLITADELVIAGASQETNHDFYLYTGQNYWTITPNSYRGSATVYYLNSDGSYTYSYGGVDTSYGVRPVINLKADTQFLGEGTTSVPYEVSG